MKRALSIVGQTLLLLFAAVLFGVVLPSVHRSPFHVVHVLSQQGFVRRQFEFDWVIGVLLVYAVLLLIGLAARRLRTSWKSSTIALLLTLAIGFAIKLGFKEGSELDGSFSRTVPAVLVPAGAESTTGATA